MEYLDDNLTKIERNVKSKSIVECIAKITIASLPHIVITLIFLVYLLLGSTILNEIEISEQITYRQSQNSKLNADVSFATAAASTSASLSKQAKYESYLLFNKYKLKLNDIYLNVLFNLRKHQSRISNDYKRFLNKLDKLLVEEIFNKTENDTESVGFDTTTKTTTTTKKSPILHIFDLGDDQTRREIKYLNTKKFISKVFKIQNDNSIFLLQTIANHLIETKKGLRMNMSKNIKQLISSFKQKHSNSEKKLFDFIKNQEDMFKSSHEEPSKNLTDKKHQINKEENNKSTILNQFEQNSRNRTFFGSVFFMAALMSKIGMNTAFFSPPYFIFCAFSRTQHRTVLFALPLGFPYMNLIV